MSSKEHNSTDEQVSDEKIVADESVNQETTLPETEDITDSRDARIAEMQAKIDELQQREREILLRTRAENENIRRRAEQDVEKAHKFALEKFSVDLLSVIDNLEKAVELADKSNQELMPMIEGVELTLKSFLDVVRKYGIEVVNELNVPFNPELHEAMTVMESDQHEPNQVMMIMQNGYILNGRLIRPARVAVSKAKS